MISTVEICVVFFSWLHCGDGCGEEDHRGEASQHTATRAHAIAMTYHCNVDLDHLAELVAVRCLLCKASFPSFQTVLFERKSLQPTQTHSGVFKQKSLTCFSSSKSFPDCSAPCQDPCLPSQSPPGLCNLGLYSLALPPWLT